MQNIKNAGRAVFIILSLLAILFITKPANSAEKGVTNVDTDIMATLSCNGYDYDVKIMVNGVDIGVKGGKSEGKRLMHKDSEMAKQAPPEKRKQFFMLESGENKIVVEFRKKTDDKYSHLDIAIEADNYPTPIVLLHTNSKASGRFEKTFFVKNEAPADFKPAFDTDAGALRSAFVQLNASTVTVTPVLNGKKAMALGMPGTVVLDNVKEGRNELSVLYQGEKGAEIKFTVVTPEGMKHITKTLPDDKEHTETLNFVAK